VLLTLSAVARDSVIQSLNESMTQSPAPVAPTFPTFYNAPGGHCARNH